MGTADWFDLMTAAMGNTASFYALFWTLVSGYLVLAFVVGERLTRSQLTIVNFLFIVSTSGTTFSAVTACRNALLAYRKGASSVEEMTALSSGQAYGFLVIMCIFNLLAILSCLKFMWDIRHSKSS